jgi:hypothetical protein
MGRKKRTEIRIETSETLTIRRRRLARQWCSECERDVVMLTIEQTAELTGATELEACRLVETGRLHFTETARGKLLICADSLARLIRTERR